MLIEILSTVKVFSVSWNTVILNRRYVAEMGRYRAYSSAIIHNTVH